MFVKRIVHKRGFDAGIARKHLGKLVHKPALCLCRLFHRVRGALEEAKFLVATRFGGALLLRGAYCRHILVVNLGITRRTGARSAVGEHDARKASLAVRRGYSAQREHLHVVLVRRHRDIAHLCASCTFGNIQFHISPPCLFLSLPRRSTSETLIVFRVAFPVAASGANIARIVRYTPLLDPISPRFSALCVNRIYESCFNSKSRRTRGATRCALTRMRKEPRP